MKEEKKRVDKRLKPRQTINTGKETQVQQSFKHETNINTIVNRFKQSGILPQGNPDHKYLDNTQFGDYTEMLSQVTEIQQTFGKFPFAIRSRFQNDPAKYVAFLEDDKNREEAIKLGLVKPPEKPEAERKGAPAPEPTPKPASAPEEPQITLDEALAKIKTLEAKKG